MYPKQSRGQTVKPSPPVFTQVDVYLVTQPPSGRWMHFDTEVTNSSGRVTYTIPQEKKLGVGVYPIRMVVK